MWLILQQNKPDDFVCATGISHTVKDLVQYVFNRVGLSKWENYVIQDEKYIRPEELNMGVFFFYLISSKKKEYNQ